MAAPRPNPRLAKLHRTYSVDEIAKLYGIHRNTVRAWIRAGLPTTDQRRPLLVLGRELAEFLRERRAAARRPCGPGEIFCVRCREPRRPAGAAVCYRPLTGEQGMLVGRCGCCNAGLNRRVSLTRLAETLSQMNVTLTQGEEHINESAMPSLNCDFAEDLQNHADASS
ncbi:MAG: DNA-binding protein [Burkholderiaceae bacterium]|nr:MAG: DNA-binding protein [Burkholderiaceae bacterium]